MILILIQMFQSFLKAPSDEEVNKDIINERKKALKEKNLSGDELKEAKAIIKKMELSLKWKNYVNKKTKVTKKVLAKIYKKEVARNGGSK